MVLKRKPGPQLGLEGIWVTGPSPLTHSGCSLESWRNEAGPGEAESPKLMRREHQQAEKQAEEGERASRVAAAVEMRRER